MAFKNLEKKFTENVNKLYRNAKAKFENGKQSNGRNDAPFVVRRPKDGYWNLAESRSLPINSAANDLKRLTLFQLSINGIKFLAKQQLLQTGNTFKFTRIINPAFVVANAVPFLHIKRNLRPLSELTGKTDTSYANVKKMGTMQSDSYDRLKKWNMPTYISNHINAKPKGSSAINKLGNLFKKTVGNKLAQAFSPITSTLSAVNPLLKRNVGEEKKWSESRPELAKDSIVQAIENANVNYQSLTDEYFKKELKENTGTKFIKYFTSAEGIKAPNNRTDSPLKTVQGNQASIVNAVLGRNKKISYIKDDANLAAYDAKANFLEPYKYINNQFDDPIVVSFAMGKDKDVRFRAFIKDLQQSATPEYKNYQYIGRIEKFVNYLGVQREISFKLGIIAFSQTEIDMVWTRINYITSFVYPYGFNKGIMQPNIIRLTIGDVYTNQPGYVTSLNTNFSGITDSWEITKGKQVPISAEMDIKFTLIEKYTKIASSPFYGITETMEDADKKKQFTQPISVPKQKDAPANPQTDAPKNNTSTSVNAETRTAVKDAFAKPTPFEVKLGDIGPTAAELDQISLNADAAGAAALANQQAADAAAAFRASRTPKKRNG